MLTLLHRQSGTTFNCFSPQVMALTFALEMILLIYVIVKHGYTSVPQRLIILILLFLATFQLSEYGVCESLGFSNEVWAKLGFASITMLPPLGLHLIQRIRNDKNLTPSYVAYFAALVFVVAFVFFNSFNSIECQGNYVIFQLKQGIGGGYNTYYYFFLLLGVIFALSGAVHSKIQASKEALILMVAGYAAFIVPATFIHFVFDQVQDGLPSIMCGFALVFALILGVLVSKRVEGNSRTLKNN